MLPKINILAFAAHPDDVEISAAGIMLKHKAAGKTTGIIDLTRGELGSRGNAELRMKEAARASDLMQLDIRENLGMEDGFFEETRENLLRVVNMIRKYKPDVILLNSDADRHPDHGRAYQLVKRAVFLSGLLKIKTELDGKDQEIWRPLSMYSYIQDIFQEPDLLIDVSDFWQQRMECLMSFSSQFYDPASEQPDTPISTPEFLKNIEGRSVQLARYINCRHAEGLRVIRPAGVDLLSDLF